MSAVESYCNFGHFNSWNWHSDDSYPRFCWPWEHYWVISH